VDLTIAEVADEEVTPEAAEAGRREREPPRCVELAVAREASDQVACKIVRVDEAAALAGDLVLVSASCFA
jgi:hypothetical protein